MTFEEFRAAQPTVTVGGKTWFVVEDDMRMNEVRLLQYWQSRVSQATPGRLLEKLVGGMGPEGRLVRWSPGSVLTYAVLDEHFPSPERAATIRQAMLEAASDWQSVCGVRFQRLDVPEHEATDRERCLFTVRQHDLSGGLIALAFFPDDPADERDIFVDPTFPATFSARGILRHELGHILGFYHEFTRHELDNIDIGEADLRSVMNYPQHGGDPSLMITDEDARAAREVYGWPVGDSKMVEPPPPDSSTV
ncbi:MAG: matrixin family metalloprotease [Myxococcota bacterium]